MILAIGGADPVVAFLFRQEIYVRPTGRKVAYVTPSRPWPFDIRLVVAKPYPHGIAIHDGIDRILVTSTVRATDLGDAGDTITAIEASTGKVLNSYKVSKKPSPAGEAPAEILFVPGAKTPVAYVTNMYGGSLWTATWNAKKKDFDVALAHDFSAQGAGVPLEMKAGPGKPKLIKSIATAEGAHHVAFTKDWRYALGFKL